MVYVYFTNKISTFNVEHNNNWLINQQLLHPCYVLGSKPYTVTKREGKRYGKKEEGTEAGREGKIITVL